ncbi:6895_t:CDS:2 [Acaulospora morrowiae]|uniref:6895_t:CDS:1 n=1 Tax=Acaulospora morrowiae TaxID=94023 RepID=A0A9N9IID5_9GLOM|nr:6895_t:CDS:2 [Acaulospora morrowiae]
MSKNETTPDQNNHNNNDERTSKTKTHYEHRGSHYYDDGWTDNSKTTLTIGNTGTRPQRRYRCGKKKKTRQECPDDNIESCYGRDRNLNHDRDHTPTTKSIAVTSTNDEFVDTEDHNSQVNDYSRESAQVGLDDNNNERYPTTKFQDPQDLHEDVIKLEDISRSNRKWTRMIRNILLCIYTILNQ